MGGTPKSLKEAISTALETDKLITKEEEKLLTRIIEIYVLDFLSQKFGAAMISENNNLEDLWKKIKA